MAKHKWSGDACINCGLRKFRIRELDTKTNKTQPKMAYAAYPYADSCRVTAGECKPRPLTPTTEQ
jgi:hypothetical protein